MNQPVRRIDFTKFQPKIKKSIKWNINKIKFIEDITGQFISDEKKITNVS